METAQASTFAGPSPAPAQQPVDRREQALGVDAPVLVGDLADAALAAHQGHAHHPRGGL